jgi:hypothetical protein
MSLLENINSNTDHIRTGRADCTTSSKTTQAFRPDKEDSVFRHRPCYLRLRLLSAAIGCLPAIHAVAYETSPSDLSSASAQRAETSPASGGTVRDLSLQSGGVQRVLYSAAKRQTKGIVIMFAGGTGELDIDKNGYVKNAKNFVVRSSDLWRERGYGIILVDALDHQSMRGQRSSAAYAEVTGKIVAFAREEASVPVWVLGTSQGSIAAMNAALHAGRTELAGLILTESVSIPGGSHETVFDAHPGDVHVPTLVVANVDDRCKVALPSMAKEIAQSIRHAPATVLTESGGVQHSRDDCASLSPHGYYGIEEKVVGDIVTWMQKTQSQL